jgi:hypothetical protein
MIPTSRTDAVTAMLADAGSTGEPMSQAVTLTMPDDVADRYRRGATAARKPLEQFLLERLGESVPPLIDQLPPSLRDELLQMEHMDNTALREIAGVVLPPAK